MIRIKPTSKNKTNFFFYLLIYEKQPSFNVNDPAFAAFW